MSLFVLDTKTITKAIRLLHPDGELFEIRLINGSYNASGYFTSAETAIMALQNFKAGWKKEDKASSANVFITLNPVDIACYARKQHDTLIEGVSPTTKDNEITAFHWLLIDLDAKRISGVSSSKSELDCAWQKSQEIYRFLAEKSFKEPIYAMSGNGFHLVYRFNALNIPENIALWEQALKALQYKFGDNTVDVDTTVFNPARICKLWGTLAQKGATTPERPHRKAYILDSTPKTIEINNIAVLKSLVSELVPNVSETAAISSVVPTNTISKFLPKKSDFDLQEFINRYQIPVTSIEHTYNGTTKYILEHCLFDESHKGKDSAIFQQSDGSLGYKCFHAHCADKHWKDVRLLFEPNAYDEKPKTKQQTIAKINISPYDADGTGTLTIDNLKKYLQIKGYNVQYNIIKHDLEYTGFKGESEEHLKEIAPALISDELQFELKKCNTGNVAEKLQVIGTRNRINPILDKIRNTSWDGKDRIAEIYNIFDIDESDILSRTLIKKWLMQAICGLFNNFKNPFSLDIVLVFQGGQGIGKTRFFEHLAMNQNYFGEGVCIDPRDKDSIMQATSVWICELGELGSTMKKDMDGVKAFFTKSMDEYRAPYGRSTLKYPRITSFVGTVNDEQFLIDQTGNRRFATVPIKPNIEIDYNTQVKHFNSLQLWTQVYNIVQDALAANETISSCFRLTNVERKALDNRNNSFVKPMKGEMEVLDILVELELLKQNVSNIYIVKEKWMTTTEFKNRHSALSRYSTVQIGRVLTKMGYVSKNMRTGSSVTTMRWLPYKEYIET